MKRRGFLAACAGASVGMCLGAKRAVPSVTGGDWTLMFRGEPEKALKDRHLLWPTG